MKDPSRYAVPESLDVADHKLQLHIKACGPPDRFNCPCDSTSIYVCRRCNKVISVFTYLEPDEEPCEHFDFAYKLVKP